MFAQFFGGSADFSDPFGGMFGGGGVGGGPQMFFNVPGGHGGMDDMYFGGGPGRKGMYSFKFNGIWGYTSCKSRKFLNNLSIADRTAGPPRQDPTVQHELAVSLEDINTGCVKKMKITRSVIFCVFSYSF